MVKKIWVLQKFSQISLVSQSRFLSGSVHLLISLEAIPESRFFARLIRK